MPPVDTAANTNDATPRWLHRLAIATACATFPLVIVGGLVTTTRVGMSDTDWPTVPWYFVWLVSVGHAMDRGLGFLIEHGHRQLGWLVGLLTMVLAAGLWWKQRRQWLRWLGVLALGAVVAQGVLGGLRVVLQSPVLGMVHGVLAQVFFAFMVCVSVFTGSSWSESPAPIVTVNAIRLKRLALITTAFVLVQLIFGATLRHLGYTWALVAHLVTAFVILVHVALIAKRVFTEPALHPRFARSVEWLGMLIVGQLMLGAGTWATSAGFGLNLTTNQSGAQIVFATAHVSLGALILAICALLTSQSYRLLVPDPDRRNALPGSRGQGRVARPSVSSLESRELWMAEVTS